MRATDASHLVIGGRRALERRGIDVGRCARCRIAVEECQHLHAFDPPARIELRDLSADIALVLDPALGLQAPDRLADRLRADAEIARDRVDHQPIAGPESPRDDRLADLLVGVVRLACDRRAHDLPNTDTSLGSIMPSSFQPLTSYSGMHFVTSSLKPWVSPMPCAAPRSWVRMSSWLPA